MKKLLSVLAILVVAFSFSTFAQPLSLENLRANGKLFLPPSMRDLRENRTRPVTSPSFPGPGIFKATGSVDTAWVRYFRNQQILPGQYHATQVVADSKGNVVVTGLTQGSSASWDFITIKYSPTGDTLWTRRYITVGNENGSPAHLAVDKYDNVYLAGATAGSDAKNADYVTIKYDPAGDTLWVRRYNGTLNGNDWANGVAVDDSGNVYVTGASASPGEPGNAYLTSDFATIKYNSAGDTLWTRRYDGPDHLGDEATGVAIDDSGNVYVAGISYGWTPSTAYVPIFSAIVKYTSAGDLVWVSRYQAPGKNKSGPAGLAVDKHGKVYLGVNCLSYYDGLSNGIDFATVKFNNWGDTLWSRIYNGPGSITADYLAGLAIDFDDNVYITGNSTEPDGPNAFMVTIKYDSQGDSLWMRTYNAPGSHNDLATSLTLDHEGNAYVASRSMNANAKWDYTTIKYAPLGDVAWVRNHNSPADGNASPASLALDVAGNVLVTGIASFSTQSGFADAFATVKYTSAGDSLWAKTYNETRPLSADNRASAFDIDGSGEAYITGTASYVTNTTAAVTVKYNTLGDTLWTRSPLGPVAAPYDPRVFKVDPNGNIYETMTSPEYDFLTVKYTPDGDTIWTRRYNGPDNGIDAPHSLTIDESGNLYVAGLSELKSYLPDYATVKYNAAGQTLWTRRYRRESNSFDAASSVAVDQSGNVYVTGLSEILVGPNNHPTGADFLTIKYNSHGDTLWVRIFDASARGNDLANLIALDAAGNVIVAGLAHMDSVYYSKSDYATIKYNPAGDTLWTRTYHGGGNGVNNPTSLAVDHAGNVFITGYSQNTDGSYDCAAVKYSPAGDTIWVKRSPQDSTSPSFVAVDADGNAYVTHSSGDADSSNLTTKYDPSGAEEWVARYSHLTNVVGMRLDKQGDVYIAGTGLTPEGPMYAVVKYAQGPTSVDDMTTQVPESFALEQNYPNPCNPSTTIRFALPQRSHLTLTVFNILGQRVAKLLESEVEAGYHEVIFNAAGLASGVYFYRMTAGAFTEVRKLLLVR